MSKYEMTEAMIKRQTEEIERLKRELDNLRAGSEAMFVLPHPMRQGVGDVWRGYRESRVRPDNVTLLPSRNELPTSQDAIEALAARAISIERKESE